MMVSLPLGWRLCWKEVAGCSGGSCKDACFVPWKWLSHGVARVCIDGVRAIGVDEIAWQRGHHYLTLVYQIDALQAPAVDRRAPQDQDPAALLSLVRPARSRELKTICSDMWNPT
ncbi:MAG: transposase [Gammaproteobacteria bacterium]|nr:transposase [Gammaproteobacteria bacterium]